MSRDLFAGIAQGLGQQLQVNQKLKEKEEIKKLQIKLFKDQLEQNEKAKEAMDNVMGMMRQSAPTDDLGGIGAGAMLKGKSLLDILADPQGQALMLQSKLMKPADVLKAQQPDIVAQLIKLQQLNPDLQVKDVIIQDGKVVPKLGPSPYSEALARERAKADVAEDIEAAKLRGRGELTEFEKKLEKAKNVSELIGEADKLLDDATGSLLGTGLALGKRAVGVSDKTTQANQKLKLLSGWLVSNVPRMEGPQSEFDVKNYQQMAGMVGDSTVPAADRKAALKTLLDLQKKYGGANGKPSLGGPGKKDDPLGLR